MLLVCMGVFLIDIYEFYRCGMYLNRRKDLVP